MITNTEQLQAMLEAVEFQVHKALVALEEGQSGPGCTALELLTARVSALHRRGFPDLAGQVVATILATFPDHPVIQRMSSVWRGGRDLRKRCKVCGREAEYFATTQLYKYTTPHADLGSGCTINYHRCFFCGFIFTEDMDHWSTKSFSEYIYNDEYRLVDPDFAEVRPQSQADHFIYKLRDWGNRLSILDYGGGKGGFATLMREAGFDVTACDPIYAGDLPEARNQFDLVTCNEVWEHVPDPHGLIKILDTYLKPDGVLWVGTHRVPDDIEELGPTWWYFAPRNGHISFHTRWSFEMLFAQYGFKYASTVDFTHVGFRHRTPLATRLDHP